MGGVHYCGVFSGIARYGWMTKNRTCGICARARARDGPRCYVPNGSRASDDVSTSRRARQGDDMDEDVAPGCSVALAIGGRMERRAWDGATTSDRDYDGGAMGRKRARRGVRATRVGWMVLMMVVVCAFMGVGDARGSENATEARRKDKKYRGGTRVLTRCSSR